MKETLQQIYGLSDELTAQLIKAGTFRTFQRGKYLGFQNEHPDALYLPINGLIGVQAPFEQRDEYFYAVFTPGTLINEMYIMSEQSRLESLKTLSEVTLLSVPCYRIRDLMSSSLEFSQLVMKSISLKLYTVTSLNYIQSEKDPEQKILKCLAYLASFNPRNRVYLNYRNLASLMVISRNTVARVVKDLNHRGVLRLEKQYISFNEASK